MTLENNNYAQYHLVQEMMDTVQTVERFDAHSADFVAESVRRTGAVMFAGEGSSRIMPAKNARRKALQLGLKVNFQNEGSRQAMEYDLSGYTVLLDSNSGRTKEVLALATLLKQQGHTEAYSLSANPDTPLEKACVKGHVLCCGWEQAVAATKSVVEQALFCESVCGTWQAKICPPLSRLFPQNCPKRLR